MLGPVRVWRGDVELTLGPPKQRALLALLLVRAGTPVSLGEIVDVLWPQEPPASAANVVHRHVGVLRRLLGPGPQVGGRSVQVVRGSGGYRIDVKADSLDLLTFRRLTQQAHRDAREGAPEKATGLYAEALTLWRGPVADGIPVDIRAHPVFTGVEQECLGAVRDAADAALASGTPDSTLVSLQQAAARYPLDEPLQARLVLSLAAAGRRGEALAAYETARRHLAEGLGIAPGRELSVARRQVLRQDVTQSAPESGGPAARGGARPARAPGPARPPIPAVRPAQLPAKLAVFTGRDRELARIDALLEGSTDTAASPPPTLTITAIDGMAGIGKTALAVHWARRVAHRFPDGQLYADLRGFDPAGAALDPSEVLRAFLHGLGVAPQDVPAGLDAQSALYRSLLADKRLLVLLDNARDSSQVCPLLPGSPGALVIVTSRNRLPGLAAGHGVHPVTLGLLSGAEAREVLIRRIGPDRVAAEPEVVESLIELCGRLPLTLAVVAARAAAHPDFPLASIAAELRESHGSLDAFAQDDVDARSVFSWSYLALDPAAARMFRLLALHPGPDISRHAAASLAGLRPREARTTLNTLTAAHLLTEQTPGRYVFHDLVRAYARERLEAEEPMELRRTALGQLLDHALRTTQSAALLLFRHRLERVTPPEPHPHTPSAIAPEPLSGQEQAADWLGTELPALRGLVQRAADEGFPVHAWQLAIALELFLDRRGLREEQIAVQRTGLAAAEGRSDPLGRAHAHRTFGFALHRMGRNDEAVTHLLRALALFTSLRHREGQARTHRSLAFLANTRMRHQEALSRYAEALEHYRATDNRSGQASVLNEIGWTHILRGHHHEALTQCSTAVALHQDVGDPNGEAAAWDSLGYAHHHLGQYAEAVACYRHALGIYREISDHAMAADTLGHIGDSLHAQGDRRAALDSWEQALAILSQWGHPDVGPLLEKVHGATSDPV